MNQNILQLGQTSHIIYPIRRRTINQVSSRGCFISHHVKPGLFVVTVRGTLCALDLQLLWLHQ